MSLSAGCVRPKRAALWERSRGPVSLGCSVWVWWVRVVVAFVMVPGCMSGGAKAPQQTGLEATEPAARAPFVPTRGRGALWMPMTWTLRLYRGERMPNGAELGASLDRFEMRRVVLVVRHVDSGAETQLPATALPTGDVDVSDAEDGANQSGAALSLADTSRSFSFEKIPELAPGRYAIEAIRGEAVDESKKAKAVTITLPLPNPIDPSDEGPMIVEVQKDAVSVVGRLAFETAVGSKAGHFSTQTRGESLEAGRLAESIIARDLNWLAGDEGAARQVPRLIKAHPMVADLRGQLAVGDPQASRRARPGFVPVGFAVEAPCDARAQLKLLWKADGETKEYVALIPLAPQDHAGHQDGVTNNKDLAEVVDPSCETSRNTRNQFVTIYMRPENWLLQATEVVSEQAPVSHSRILALQQPSMALRRYYATEDVGSLAVVSSLSEQQIRRRFYLPLRDLRGVDNQLYYGGQIAVTRLSGSEETKAEQQKAAQGGALAWGVALKKSFNAAELRRVFGRQRLWNPFTGAAIEAETKLGRVDATLQIAADAKKSDELSPYVAGIRKSLTEAFARCVQRHEEGDPLLVARTRLQFQIAARQRAVTLDHLVIDPQAGTDTLALCFRKEFDAFRFARPVPAGFRAEMELKIE